MWIGSITGLLINNKDIFMVKFDRICMALVCMVCSLNVSADDLKLWYSRPATVWTAAVLSDISVGQLDVFGAFYQFHKIAEPLPLDTCGIQFVKNKLHIVVFRVADFLFL